MAGESARDLARRQRERADRLLRSAEMYERGADGEAATAQALATLPSAEWAIFHDVRWPGRALANVDHVAVGPGGVFVIDSKNWTGRIEVKDSVLRQNGYQREKTVVGAAEAAIAVSLVTPDLPGRLAVPVLCFVRDEQLTGWARDVMVCTTANIAAMLTSRPIVLDPETCRMICLSLDLSLRDAREQGRPPAPTPRRPVITAQQRRPLPAAPRQPRRRRKTKRLSLGGWVKGGLGVAIVGTVLLAPSVYQSAVTGISGLIAEVLVPDTEPGPVQEGEKGERKRQPQQSTD